MKKKSSDMFSTLGRGSNACRMIFFFGWVGRILKRPTFNNLLAKRGTLRDLLI